MLVDDVTITIRAGNGGNGAATLKRNAQTAKGGPDGGNGGNGGNIYIQGVNDILGLRQFRFKKRLEAESGTNGRKQNLYGRNGNDLILYIPVGTRITDTKRNNIHEIVDTTTKILIGRGGKGGRGNNEFKSATNQTPRYAEKGEPGEEKFIRLELMLIADIGLIGLPNAGKSSLLETLTNATPKIGDYPFTTLEPNLGVMEQMILADIPGLIEGAHLGKGLGTRFLKHVEKTKFLVHCIDGTLDHPLETYQTVRGELSSYNKKLTEKPEIILITKVDLITQKEETEKIKLFQTINPHTFSVSIYKPESITILHDLLIRFFTTFSSQSDV